MQIHTLDNKLLLDVLVDDSSLRFKEIMGENNLTLKFSLDEFIEVPLGSYADFKGERYSLYTPENFVKNHTEHFDYMLTLEAYQALMKFVKFKFITVERNPGQPDMITGAAKLKFSLTATPEDFARLLVDCMNFSGDGGGWTVGECLVSDPVTVDFNHDYCNAALQKIADAFKTEWEVENKTVHIRKVEKMKDSAIRLSYGYQNGILGGITRKQFDDSKVINRVWIQGGDRNINYKTYGNDTLLLPKNDVFEYEGVQYRTDPTGSYLERADRKGALSEDSLDTSKVYPKREGTVSQVIEVDDSKGFYDFIDTSVPDTLDFDKLVIPGEDMEVIFQTGQLAGKEGLKVKYYHTEKRFAIVPTTDKGLTYPKGTLIPAVGDKYGVFHMSLPQEYIDAAQQEAKIETVKYLFEKEQPKYTYLWKLDGIYAKEQWGAIGGFLSPGYFVEFSDPQFLPEAVDIRITSVKEYINKPKSPTIELSNNVTGKALENVLNEIPTQEQAADRKYEAVREYAKRRWNDTQELIDGIMGMTDEFKENLLSSLVFEGMVFRAGAASLQYRFLADDWHTSIEPGLYFNSLDKRFYCPASKIVHETIEINGLKPYWTAPEFRTDALTQKKTPYNLYLKCSRQLTEVNGRLTGEASYFISDQKIKIDDIEGYTVLWVALINSENEEGTRSFATMYGLGEFLPGQLTVDTWRTADGNSFIKGLKNQIKIGGFDWNVTDKDTLTILNAFFRMINKDGETVVDINGQTGAAMFGKGAHKFNPDGSLDMANSNIVWDAIKGLLVTGKFESSKDGNRIVIAPENKMLGLYDATGNLTGSFGFDVEEDKETGKQYTIPSIELKGFSEKEASLAETYISNYGTSVKIQRENFSIHYQFSTAGIEFFTLNKVGASYNDTRCSIRIDDNGNLRIRTTGLSTSPDLLSVGDWWIDSYGNPHIVT
jgi:hypothetical protein